MRLVKMTKINMTEKRRPKERTVNITFWVWPKFRTVNITFIWVWPKVRIYEGEHCKHYSTQKSFLVIFGHTHTIWNVNSAQFQSNSMSKNWNVYSPPTFLVILQSQIQSSLFGHLNNPPWKHIIANWSQYFVHSEWQRKKQ